MKSNNNMTHKNWKKFIIYCFILALIIPANLVGTFKVPHVQAIEVDENFDPAPCPECESPVEEVNDDLSDLGEGDFILDKAEFFEQQVEAVKILEEYNKVPSGVSQLLIRGQNISQLVIRGAGYDRIYLNPLDEILIFGEPCAPDDPFRWLCTQTEGDKYIKANPDADIFANERWDGPEKLESGQYRSLVDRRILEMLDYLVTPTWEGGAGRERITISKIGEYIENDKEQHPPMAEGEEPLPQKSLHYLGQINPGKTLRESGGKIPIQGIDISEIDSVRIATKIVKKRRVGNDRTSYKYQRPMPLKVAWQSDKGQEKAGVPPVDIMTGGEDMFKAGLIDLLAEFDLSESLSPDDLDDVDLRSIATFIGGEMLSTALDSPSGSLKGFDVGDTIEKLGRYVIAGEFDLPKEAFATGNSIDDIERNLGQYILEERFSIPHGSFNGNSSGDLLENAGRRWLEEDVFSVAPGTLDYQDEKINDSTLKKEVFLRRLGIGRIAQVFNIKPTEKLLSSTNYSQLEEQGGLRMAYLFNDKNDPNYIDEYLGIAPALDDRDNPVKRDTDPTGMTPDPQDAHYITTETFIRDKDQRFADYLKTTGQYVFESALGMFRRENIVADSSQRAERLNQLVSLELELEDWSNNDSAYSLYRAARDKLTANPPQDSQGNPLNSTLVNYALTENINGLDVNLLEQDFAPRVRINGCNFIISEVIAKYQNPNPNLNLLLCGNTSFRVTSDHLRDTLDAVIVSLHGEINQPESGELSLLERIARKLRQGFNEEEANLADVSNHHRQAVVEAIKVLQERASVYLDQANRIRQLIGSTTADEAMGFMITPELLSRLRDPGFNPEANALNQALASYRSDSASLVTRLQQGDLSILPGIGLIKISQKTSQSPREQATIQVSLLDNVQSFFNRLANLGLSEVHVNGRFGLVEGDYDRLFLKNMATSVFERIGQAELLAAVYRHPEFQEGVNRLRLNPEYQALEETAAEAVQTLDFYTSRINNIYNLAVQSEQETEELETLIGADSPQTDKVRSLKDNLNQVVEIYNCASGTENCQNLQFKSVATAKQFVGTFEYNYGTAFTMSSGLYNDIDQGVAKAAAKVNSIQQKMSLIGHNLQEISAGKALEYRSPDQAFDYQADPTETEYQNARLGRCWQAGEIASLFLQSGSLGSSLEGYLKQVGGCELDNRLYLPVGSTYFFYKSPEQTKESFFYSVGRSWYLNRRQPIPSDEATVRTAGERIVINQSVRYVAARSGLFRNIADQYGIGPDEIFQMASGNTDAVVMKVGGKMIDERLNFTPGTASGLIDPCQIDEEIIGSRNCKDKQQREEIRTHLLAREGLRQLGLEMIDLPMNVNLTSGNFRDNLGIAKISESLGGLKLVDDSNHPYPTIEAIKNANGIEKTMSNFGIMPTPFLSLLSELRLSANSEFAKISARMGGGSDLAKKPNKLKAYAVEDDRSQFEKYQDYQKLIAELDRLITEERTDLWNRVTANNHFYWLNEPLKIPDNQMGPDNDNGNIYYNYVFEQIVRLDQKIMKGQVEGEKLIDLAPESFRTKLASFINLTSGNLLDPNGYARQLGVAFKNNAFIFQNALNRLDGEWGTGDSFAYLPDIDPEEKVNGVASGIANTYGNSGQYNTYNYGDDHDKISCSAGEEVRGRQYVECAKQDGRLPNGNPDHPIPSAASLLRGAITPPNMIKGFGEIALWKMGVDLVGAKYPDTFIGKSIANYDQFRQAVNNAITIDGRNGQVPLIEQIFSGRYARQYAAETGGGDFWTELFIGNTEPSAAARGFVFDRFLANTFSAKLEASVGVEYGAMKNLFMRPYLAKEIAVDQGMNKIASQLFQVDDGDSKDQREVKYALGQVFNAGFMIDCANKQLVDENNEIEGMCKSNQARGSFFTYHFNDSRAYNKVQELVEQRITDFINRQLGDVKEKVGVTLSLADINGIFSGDINTFGYLAAAYTITSIGKKAVDKYGHDGVRRRGRSVSYDLARLSFVGDPDNPAIYEAGNQSVFQAKVDFIDSLGMYNSNISDDENIRLYYNNALNTAYSTDPGGLIEHNRQLNTVERQAEKQEGSRIKKQAQQKFQYQMTDYALYLLNDNFPAGFSEAFMGANATEETRSDALLLFGINNLIATGNSEWAGLFAAFTPNGENIGLSTVRNFRFMLDILSCDGITDSADCRTLVFTAIANNEALMNFVEGNFQQWVGKAFGVELKYGMEGLFDGLIALGITGKINEGVTMENKNCTFTDSSKCQRRLPSLKDVAEDWASTRIFMWADRTLGFDTGISKAIYDNGKQLYEAYKKYRYIRAHKDAEIVAKFGDGSKTGAQIKADAKGQLKQAQAVFITFAVTTIFKSQIANMEQKLGLVPGTGAMAVGMLINLIVGVPVDPITIALFIGLNLFGYYKIVVTVRGTADGYYPFKGQYGDYTFSGIEIQSGTIITEGTQLAVAATKVKSAHSQYPSPDPPIGEFDGKDNAAYKSYLKTAAQAKIEGLLIDIATMPERWQEATGNLNPNRATYDLMPLQVYTMMKESVDAVAPFISRPNCTSQAIMLQNNGCGYGPLESREGTHSGFWANSDPDDTSFWDHIHVGY